MTRNRPGPRIARLRLEYLEDRSVPSTFTVNTTLDDVTPANGKLSHSRGDLEGEHRSRR